ncbi:MAG: PIG-L family deacetylase [Chloroflexi bacterium]|nr:PIG-L family deacetylase [Chloroflexota bacterium]
MRTAARIHERTARSVHRPAVSRRHDARMFATNVLRRAPFRQVPAASVAPGPLALPAMSRADAVRYPACGSTHRKAVPVSASLEDLFGEQAPGAPDLEAGELERAMVIAGHPDDADFGAAGTSALLALAGWEVRYLVVTDGSKGSDDPKFTTETLVATRDKEQRDAARVLGVASVGFLGYTDGELTYSRQLLGDITREIRAFRPHAVFTHDPEPVIHDQGFINHNDHRITGLATVDAVYPTARDRLNFPEHLADGLDVHKVAELYLWGSNKASFDVDISAVVETKIDALMAHVSQFGDREEFAEFALERWRDEDGRYLESFRQVVMFR